MHCDKSRMRKPNMTWLYLWTSKKDKHVLSDMARGREHTEPISRRIHDTIPRAEMEMSREGPSAFLKI